MQAVLLAAGESSRFFPYNIRHKCLVEIAGEPIIVHTVKAVKRAGITDIIIVVPNEVDFQQVLGNGKKYGVKIRYVVFPIPTGAGDAILASGKLISDDFFLINSNHVDFDELKHAIDKKRDTNNELVLLAAPVEGKKHFGVLKVEGDRVLSIIEKPKDSKDLSNLRVIGVYFLNSDFVKVLKKVKSHHYSLEDAIDACAKSGKVRFAQVQGEPISLKYPWDLLNVKNYILNKLIRNISKKANVSKNAIIEGNVVICEGATINENAVVKGPCYIGKDAYVGSNSLVRNGSSVEEGAVVGGYMEVKNSLIMRGAKTHSGHFEDSILGENARIGAHFTSANVKLNRKNVESVIRGEKVDTNLRDLGVIIGSGSHLGVKVATMPGVIIGNNVNIGPSTTVMRNIDSDTSYYTKFAEVVEKKKPVSKSS